MQFASGLIYNNDSDMSIMTESRNEVQVFDSDLTQIMTKCFHFLF